MTQHILSIAMARFQHRDIDEARQIMSEMTTLCGASIEWQTALRWRKIYAYARNGVVLDNWDICSEAVRCTMCDAALTLKALEAK